MRAPRVVRSLHPRGRREQTCCYPRQDLPESSWSYTLAETILGDWSNQLCLDFNLQSGRVVKRQATTLSGFRGELMNMRTMLRLALLLGGIGMGLWHLKLGVRAGFVARNDEPLSFWIFFTDRPILNIACFYYLLLSTCYRWNMAVLWSINFLRCCDDGIGTQRGSRCFALDFY